MSKINAVRSITLISSPKTFSNSRCWRGESSSSKRTTLAFSSATTPANSSTLPEPISVDGSGLFKRCVNCPTTTRPAVSASSASSANESSKVNRPGDELSSTPTSTARSMVALVETRPLSSRGTTGARRVRIGASSSARLLSGSKSDSNDSSGFVISGFSA